MPGMSCGAGLLKNQVFRPVHWGGSCPRAGERGGRSHQTVADGKGDGRATAAHPQLAADTFDVSHRGPRADAQRRGDLPVRHAPDEQPQHIELAITQSRGWGWQRQPQPLPGPRQPLCPASGSDHATRPVRRRPRAARTGPPRRRGRTGSAPPVAAAPPACRSTRPSCRAAGGRLELSSRNGETANAGQAAEDAFPGAEAVGQLESFAIEGGC